ncbi:hypothetical protein SARC_01980 [Sphaeroforma arctica JP610]|uniref:Uncharacterized protein n=1 Tax=Sphaeroforma arctica JP610 TaxID=667725 RepID=A0A0L0GAF9_9EUKA|nr:hypothetical protein SARC_01980 [Sphaeroforma arctica JP610]KNC85871.1 hypothetical protein SARC_01980 [Sphaeroforma arctica JP610]|eukprot:XP_014159773.1 hypothetical protein SARC_01980 [Sphaeroforma arctica JP610]
MFSTRIIVALLASSASAISTRRQESTCTAEETQVRSGDGTTRCVASDQLSEHKALCSYEPVEGFMIDTIGSEDSKKGTLYVKSDADAQICDGLLSFIPDGTKISYIEPGTFDTGFERLRGIDLFDNEIEHISDFAFEGLDSLVIMDLAKNKLTELDANDLSKAQPSITFLLLDNNQISQIAEDTFQSATQLQQLILVGNELTGLPEQTFAKSIALNSLSLDNNPWLCEDIVPALSVYISDDLRVVDTLSENPFDTGKYGECTFENGTTVDLRDAVPPPPVVVEPEETGIFEIEAEESGAYTLMGDDMFPFAEESDSLSADDFAVLEEEEEVVLKQWVGGVSAQTRTNSGEIAADDIVELYLAFRKDRENLDALNLEF